jgi:DNA mismatch repair protein MutS2
MNDQAFRILEFDALRGLVRRYAQTELGRARIDELVPVGNYERLMRQLRAAGEMIELRQRGARLSFAELADSTESIARLKIAGTALDPLAMLDLARLCDRAIDARAALAAEREA